MGKSSLLDARQGFAEGGDRRGYGHSGSSSLDGAAVVHEAVQISNRSSSLPPIQEESVYQASSVQKRQDKDNNVQK